MKVMKFGGSSVRDADHIRRAVDIFSASPDTRAVICSAMKGITNDLIDGANRAAAGDESYRDLISAIRIRKLEAIQELFSDIRAAEEMKQAIEAELEELNNICHGVFLVRECSPRSLDLIMSFGERMSNRIIAAYAASRGEEVFFVDARELVLTDDSHGEAEVLFAESYERIRSRFHSREGTGIVTGFIASSPRGITTTLGRNGSDYSAAIFGAALSADDIEIWTDVDGVLQADPRVVPGAGVIRDLSVEEAMELSYFGAEVLHPSTMIPAVEAGIPVWIKNTLNPDVRGTRIARNVSSGPGLITGIASIPGVSLINVIGGGMVGSKGTAMKVFSAFARAGANAIMISQASSEHSICVVVRSSEAARAVRYLREALEHEIRHKIIQEIQEIDGLEVVAVIGGNMRGKPGVSGQLFHALGGKNINVLAIAQGSSEMNISFVIDEKDHSTCLNCIHTAFFPQSQE
ncbi:aspartate kinase [Salinispira pacifica]|uniref:Aspartokinase n=1 Tax=Salinispira pacifica TaxID=1307761 RepID=V5WCL0_9SPIO|nr:aspartate kinase [Salinispira pacifica]AHC13518.1 Aspartokinase/ Homoserine dehydrogenase [Salinispira pacifica]